MMKGNRPTILVTVAVLGGLMLVAGVRLMGPGALLFLVPYLALLFWPSILGLHEPRPEESRPEPPAPRSPTPQEPDSRTPAQSALDVGPYEGMSRNLLEDLVEERGIPVEPGATKTELIRSLRQEAKAQAEEAAEEQVEGRNGHP